MPCARFAPLVTDCGVAARRDIDAAHRARSHAISFAGTRAFLHSFTAGVMTQSCCHHWLLGHCSAALRCSVKDTRVVSHLGFPTKVL